MKPDVGSNFLKASVELTKALKAVGQTESYSAQQALFAADERNEGVFLVVKGKVGMTLQDAPKLDRVFGPGSLLGLPSTFTENPYSLTALTLTDADVVHVPAAPFLGLMRTRPDLCREATDMLCKETAFIQNALAERRRHALVVG